MVSPCQEFLCAFNTLCFFAFLCLAFIAYGILFWVWCEFGASNSSNMIY